MNATKIINTKLKTTFNWDKLLYVFILQHVFNWNIILEIFYSITI